METFWQDLRFGLRSLARSRGFTAAALLSLALGSGVTSSIFSVVRAVLLTPLPYPDSEDLVIVEGVRHRDGEVQDWPVSYLDFRDIRENQSVFEDLAAHGGAQSFNISVTGEPDHIDGEIVSGSYFHILGAVPVVGRTFSAEEDRVPTGLSVAVISHGLWQRRFGGERDLGRIPLNVAGERYQVVGVMPSGFRGLSDKADIWLPVGRAGALIAPRYLELRFFRWFTLVGRLRPGETLARAQARLDAIGAELAQAYPTTNKQIGFRVGMLVEDWYGDLRPLLLTLLAAAAFVLLIACTNVTNLLVVRGLARQSELSIRASVGASRWHLVRQLLAEAGLLALGGGVLGLLGAAWTTGLLVRMSTANFRSYIDIRVDGLVVGVSLGATLACCLGASLLPALSATRTGFGALLKQAAKSSLGRERRRLQNLLVVVEVALSVVLLIGAVLLAREIQRLRNLDLGFRHEELLTLRLDLADRLYRDEARVRALVRMLTDRLSRVPGAGAVAFASDVPTDEGFWTHYIIEGRTLDDSILLRVHSVTPEYFSTLGIPLIAGRGCTEEDTETAPPVVMVSRELARQWPDGQALGRRLRTARMDPTWVTVVGVVDDVMQGGPQGADIPDLYYCLRQSVPADPPLLGLLVRPDGVSAASLATAVTQAVREVASTLSPYDVATVEQRLEAQTARGRFLALLMALFSALALLMAVIGIYGVISYNVGQRRREIGIRMALGADRGAILRLIVLRGAALALVGVLAGLLLALWVNRMLAGWLIGTFESLRSADPLVLASSSLAFMAAAVAAAYVPARRASRLEAALTLREE